MSGYTELLLRDAFAIQANCSVLRKFVSRFFFFFFSGQGMVTRLLKMQMLSDDDELAYSPDPAK